MFRFVTASRFSASVVLQQVRTGSSSSKLPIGHTKAKPKKKEERRTQLQAALLKDLEASLRKQFEAELEEKRQAKLRANLKKSLEAKLERDRYTKELQKIDAEQKLENARRAKLLRHLKANTFRGKWSAPTALNVLKIDATAVGKAADWATMGTLACVGLPESRDNFDGRFRNTAADDSPALAQNIRDHAISVLEFPSKAQVINECSGKLFIRNRYLPYIAARVEASFSNPRKIETYGCGERLIITAQPGIGKSVGVGNYLVHYFARKFTGDASAVIVVRSSTHFHIIHDGNIESLPDVDRYDVDKSQESVLCKLQSPPYQHVVKKVLLVHDVKTLKKRTPRWKPLFYENSLETQLGRLFNSVTAVQLAPPKGVNDHGKDGLSVVSKIVIPAWAYDELESLQAHDPKTVTVEAKQEPYYTYRYDLFGGVLRTREIYLVDAMTVVKHRAELRAKSTFKEFFNFDTFATSSEPKKNVPSDVALIVPNTNFTNFSGCLDFVSDEVLIYCKSTETPQVHPYWTKRMKTAATDSERGDVLESLMKSELLLWRIRVAEYRYQSPTVQATAPYKCPFHYRFFDGSTSDDTMEICPGPFEHIVMHVSPDGREFANMPKECNNALGGGAGSVLVTFSNPSAPAIDFALLTRANSSEIWSAFLFKCTVASNHPFPKAAANVLERLFEANGPAVLNAFVWVGRKDKRGVMAPQGDKEAHATVRFRGKQASMILGI